MMKYSYKSYFCRASSFLLLSSYFARVLISYNNAVAEKWYRRLKNTGTKFINVFCRSYSRYPVGFKLVLLRETEK